MESRGEPECPVCGDSGWVRVADGGAGAARPCDCARNAVVPHLLEKAGIPPRYRACLISNFQTTTPRLLDARQRCQRYVDEFLNLEGRFSEIGLLFMGPSGTGKTHLASAVLSDLIRSYGARGRFVDFTSLVHRIQSTFDPSSPESKHDVLDPVIDAQVLVLDELGALKPSPFVHDTLYLILNSRYSRRAPTIFTTNYELSRSKPWSPSEGEPKPQLLGDRISDRLVSRLHEMAIPVVLDTSDFRLEFLAEKVRR